MMNNLITNKPSMTSLEIAELVEKRHDNVKRTIETLIMRGVITSPQIGNMRAGYVGYRQVVAKSGMTDAKCRNLVNAYRIPTDTHEFMTPDGLLSRRVALFLTPEITSQSSGFFIMKTILSGKTHHALRAYKHLIREAKQ